MLLLIGFLFTVLMLVFIGGMSGMVAFFIDIPSALLILGPLVFFLAISKSGKIMGRYIKSGFTKNYTYTKPELERISSAMKNTGKFVLAMGGCGFVAGLIGSLANIGAPERLGPNLAVSLITLMYSITVSAFVFFPAHVWAENKINLSET